MKKVSKFLEDNSISRRSFLKGTLALSAMAGVYGCSSREEDSLYSSTDNLGSGDDEYFTETPVYRYGTSAHNCGGRCIIKAQVVQNADGENRIVRFLTDETDYTGEGNEINVDHRNAPQFRACSRCRAYKGRLYHPGRLKYPLKQTKKRGDVTGFERTTWDKALQEITDIKNAIQGKYGKETVHAIYACGNIYSIYQSASYSGVFASNDQVSPALRLLGGSTGYTSDYSFHQVSYAGGWYGTAWNGFNTGSEISIMPSADTVASVNTDIVLWGANTPTTHNPVAHSWVKSMEEMKLRNDENKVWFIGPELSEIGIAQADEWIQIRPYTDTALVLGMLYHMLDNTFDLTNGTVKSDPMLDIDYIDTMVYGFFASPEYYLNLETGEISTNNTTGSIKIDEVPAGRSLADYILGSDAEKLSNVTYANAGSSYTAKQFGNEKRFSSAGCTYQVTLSASNTAYLYKKDFNTPKTPKWASEITGVPESKIIELAELYADSSRRIWNEWAGGLQKQAEGVSTILAIQALCIITKVWGYKGGGFMNQAITPTRTANANQLTDADLGLSFTADDGTASGVWANVPAMRVHPQPSVAQWHNAIKAAFGDELANNGYEPTNIADWGNNGATETGYVYSDDGGVKALVKRDDYFDAEDNLETYNENGHVYYKYDGYREGGGNDTYTYAGFRFILNTGGNIPVNQHPNCTDLAKMYECLPTYGYGDNKVDDAADSFCLVTFDNFMSPSARYSDYVLPAKTTWEQEDFKYLDQSDTTNIYIDNVIEGPGESKSTWDFARDFIKYCSGEDAAAQFTGVNADTTFKDVVQNAFTTKANSGVGPYAGKSWDEFLEKPFVTPEYNTTSESYTRSALRENLDNYLSSDNMSNPFIYMKVDVDAETGETVKDDDGNEVIVGNYVTCATPDNHYGFGWGQYSNPDACPNVAYRFMVYMPQLVWCYENAYSKWHGHLPEDQRGQSNVDDENDAIVYPIPIYFNYEDYFAQAYGITDRSILTDAKANGYYFLTTTHDRFRAHSSQAENPYLRELTHRVKGGELYSGNDSGYYAVASDYDATADNDSDNTTFSYLNTLIGEDGLPIDGYEDKASYADIWVNDEDFAGYSDGDLVKVYNKVGTVYCTIRKTARCVSGYVGLHQGCWYDPRTIEGQIVDVGGNCNTIMASRPSRYDHGNAAQSAMVKIERVK